MEAKGGTLLSFKLRGSARAAWQLHCQSGLPTRLFDSQKTGQVQKLENRALPHLERRRNIVLRD